MGNDFSDTSKPIPIWTTWPTVLRLRIGAKDRFYANDGISIWAPFDNSGANDPDADPNQFSYVIHIQFGQCSIVLGGDLPESHWAELHTLCNGKFPKVHLLKASHHGRKSGYHRQSVQAMSPDVTILSVGELKTKDDASSSSYERCSVDGCYSTVDHGNITALCWDDGTCGWTTRMVIESAGRKSKIICGARYMLLGQRVRASI